MSDQIIVGIDVDGVLANLTDALIPLIQRDYGVEIRPEDVNRWDYYVDVTGSVSRMLALMDEAWESGDVPPEEPDLVKSLRLLKPFRFHRLILSARTKPSHPAVVRWLHDQQIPYDSMALLGNGLGKFEFPVDVLIDDRPSLAEDVRMFPSKFLYLRDQPWNRDCGDLPPNAKRVASVAEAVGHILMTAR